MKGRLPEGGCSDAVPGGWAHQDGYSSLGGVPAGEADGNWVGGDEKAVLTSQEIGKSFVSGDR